MIDPGTILAGRYRVVRLLGEGAMGAVYEAEHLAIARRVAVKVMHERFARNAAAQARFAREARAAGSIGHENIVQVMDFGTWRDLPFLVMELLKGETLGERMARSGPLDPRAACNVIGHVLSALASVHAVGIVHRDLKPENVFLVARRGAEEAVKILDFGISKFRLPHDGARFATQEGTPMGTPSYMAPEQWMGLRDIDHRADLFAAGVMLFEMLTGGLPYEGASHAELLLEVVKGTAPPPAPSAIAPGVPPALDPIALRAVAREREQRFATAQEFLDALRPHGAGDVPVVPDPPAAPRSDRERESTPPRVSSEPRALTEVDDLAAAILRPGPVRRATPALAAVTAVALLAVLLRPGARHGVQHAASVAGAAGVRSAVAPVPAVPPGDVRVELRGLPPGATVLLDGAPQSSPVLRLARSSGPRTIEVRADAARRTLVVRPDQDQVLMLDLAAPAAASPVAPAAPLPPSRRSARSTARGADPRRRGTPAGTGGLDIGREF